MWYGNGKGKAAIIESTANSYKIWDASINIQIGGGMDLVDNFL